MKTYKIKTQLIILLVVITISLIDHFYQSNKNKDMKDCHKIVPGYVVKKDYSAKVLGVIFEYQYNGVKYSNKGSSDAIEFVGKKLPVILSCDDPEWSQLLVTPEDFAKYNLEFPDSLNWTFAR